MSENKHAPKHTVGVSYIVQSSQFGLSSGYTSESGRFDSYEDAHAERLKVMARLHGAYRILKVEVTICGDPIQPHSGIHVKPIAEKSLQDTS